MRIMTALAACAALTLTVTPAIAAERRPAVQQDQESGRDQDRAYDATQSGKSMPLPMIERRVVPLMGGAQYLGPEFRGKVYRLKFLADGRVIWVDVDARTGRIVRRSSR